MNIQTHAYNIAKKPTKDYASSMLSDLYLNASEEDKKSLAALYKYFMPTQAKTVKTDSEWVFKATGKNDLRAYLKLSYSDGEFLVATDGDRLHYIETDLKPGFYDAKANKIESDSTFPDYKRLLPENNLNMIELNVEKLKVTGDKVKSYIIPLNGIDYKVNVKFLNDFLNGFNMFTVKAMYENDGKSALYFESAKNKGLIMPIFYK